MIQRCRVTPSQARTLVEQLAAALDRGDTGAAKGYAEALRSRLETQTMAENVVLDEAARKAESRAERPPQGDQR